MRHALFAAAVAVLLAAHATSAQSQTDGEAAFRESCGSCHRTPARFMRRFLDMPPAQRQAELDAFLAGHHAPDSTRRATIIAWLEANHTRR